MKHTTKDGKEIALKDLEIGHLKNIISMIERKAKEGITIYYGGGSFDVDSIWYEKEILKENAALEEMNYYEYINELNRRKAIKKANETV